MSMILNSTSSVTMSKALQPKWLMQRRENSKQSYEMFAIQEELQVSYILFFFLSMVSEKTCPMSLYVRLSSKRATNSRTTIQI